MTGTAFVSDKHFTFDCDLDLGHGNLNFVRDTPFSFCFSFLCHWMKFLLSYFSNG